MTDSILISLILPNSNIDEINDTSNSEAVIWLEYLLQRDLQFTENGKVPVLFWYGVCTPK